MEQENNFKKQDEEIKNKVHKVAYEAALPLWYIRTRNVTYYVLWVIEVLLLLRFTFKLLGASVTSGFVVLLYSFTRIFVAPFIGIFNTTSTAQFIFEPATIVAMLIYAIIAYGVIKLVKMSHESAS